MGLSHSLGGGLVPLIGAMPAISIPLTFREVFRALPAISILVILKAIKEVKERF